MDFKKIMSEMLLNIKKNEITISTELNNNSEIINKSKIGGKPYLPKDFVWPYYQELPLSFLAQINLEEVNSFDKDKLLPSIGMLYFFYELETEEWGYELKNKGCSKVLYFEDTSNFESIDFPKDMKGYCQVPEFKVTFKANISYPSYEDFDIIHNGGKEVADNYEDFQDAYFDIYNKHMESLDSYTKLLGYPDVIQSSMEEQCAAITKGFYMGGIDSPKKYREEVIKDSKDWILLFQMDAIEVDDYELRFEDSGHIYFWIEKEDLKNKNFDNVWLILQFYE